ncbi:hypothetical protein [Pantoea sp. JKS000250]|uniref:hypothetical protein n=1 Tax=Pantoea sp. JKS000250 TaxID=1938795 RepID=UPI000D768E7F|nr:hypothetical protein [Pantoea sp. JKS000250]PXW21006.1 hypothetical protein BY447_2684 [Pantoea sp. JKS000250]
MSDYKEYNRQSFLGKVPVTLLLDDFETASTLTILARQYKIPVLEENVITSELLSKADTYPDVMKRLQEIEAYNLVRLLEKKSKTVNESSASISITKSDKQVDAISRVQQIAEQMNKSKDKPSKEQNSIVDKLIQTIKK